MIIQDLALSSRFAAKSCIRCTPPGIKRLSRLHSSDASLRILFCGSDSFSITSLDALHQYSQSSESNIESIRVACKNDHRTGRGLTQITSPPILHKAKQLELPYHQFDTFRGWNLPTQDDGSPLVNLIVAVSFGLLVPPRILNACKYGGLNVHPSMLPDLKGSAPIEHSVLYGDSTTGVTVQTLHPSKFDEGQILLQTRPTLDIPDASTITAQALKEYLAPIGAEMLVQALREQRYLLRKGDTILPETSRIRPAAKIRKSDAQVDFASMTAIDVLRRHRAIGNLWMNPADGGTNSTNSRIVFGTDIRLLDLPSELQDVSANVLNDMPPGQCFVLTTKVTPPPGPIEALIAKTIDGQYLSIPTLKVAGQPLGLSHSEKALRKAKLLQPGMAISDTHEILLLKQTTEVR